MDEIVLSRMLTLPEKEEAGLSPYLAEDYCWLCNETLTSEKHLTYHCTTEEHKYSLEDLKEGLVRAQKLSHRWGQIQDCRISQRTSASPCKNAVEAELFHYLTATLTGVWDETVKKGEKEPATDILDKEVVDKRELWEQNDVKRLQRPLAVLAHHEQMEQLVILALAVCKAQCLVHYFPNVGSDMVQALDYIQSGWKEDKKNELSGCAIATIVGGVRSFLDAPLADVPSLQLPTSSLRPLNFDQELLLDMMKVPEKETVGWCDYLYGFHPDGDKGKKEYSCDLCCATAPCKETLQYHCDSPEHKENAQAFHGYLGRMQQLVIRYGRIAADTSNIAPRASQMRNVEKRNANFARLYRYLTGSDDAVGDIGKADEPPREEVDTNDEPPAEEMDSEDEANDSDHETTGGSEDEDDESKVDIHERLLKRLRQDLCVDEQSEGVTTLGLSVYKAQCMMHCPPLGSDYFRAQDWINSGWKVHKKEELLSGAVALITMAVSSFLDAPLIVPACNKRRL